MYQVVYSHNNILWSNQYQSQKSSQDTKAKGTVFIYLGSEMGVTKVSQTLDIMTESARVRLSLSWMIDSSRVRKYPIHEDATQARWARTGD